MKKTIFLSALAIAFTFTSITAVEANAKYHGGPKKLFEKKDLNKDGRISKEEYVQCAEKRFKKMDANNDGSISKEEARKHHTKKRKHRRVKRNSN